MDGTNEDNRVGLDLGPGFPNRIPSGEKPDPPQRETIQEIEIVRAARQVILDALTKGLSVSSMRPDGTYVSVELAKWVIENIWTPELEPTD